tara:strand:+ start:14108 stop:15037 length:930 start_codon:yes stop_codon:yes gene_type:complete
MVTLGIIGMMIWGCTEWQEPQIGEEQVYVLTPRDSLKTDVATQLFYWYGVEGATHYELQIVTPNFGRIDQLVLDTNVSGTKYQFTLNPGEYEWSIRAYNNSSSTGYTVHRLYIDSTLNLNNQQLILKSPSDNDTTNNPRQIFKWQSLYNADSYRFELWKNSFTGDFVLFRDTPKDTLAYNVPGEGRFVWRVRGENPSSNTIYSDRAFYLDTTLPNTPVLQQPDDGDFINSAQLDFQWTRGSQTGSSIRDTFFLATDPNMTDLRERRQVKGNTLSLDTLSNGVYYWRVRSYDKAGNTSSYSSTRQFTLQP